jgi:hypothetical protein
MLKPLRFAAVALISGAAIALTTSPIWAFSQQTISPNGNYNFNYTDPDKAKLGESTNNKSDPNSLGFHFSIERNQPGSSGFRSFGNGNNDAPPDLYTPHGGGN